jgi:hypothetical protein
VELELAGNRATHSSLAATVVKMVKDNGFRRLSFLRGVAPIDVALILGS